ncbi:MAG TPA: hypothetical protein VMW35_17990 [Myxococcota bacterium]|nr:hypothetical protein [Myxococcota bacterium]
MTDTPGEEQTETPVERLSEGGGSATGPSGPAYAALAEGHRRAGRAHEAETLARAGLRVFPGGSSGRLALALALLDQRRIEEARREVEGLLESLAEFSAARGALAALIGESEPEAEPELELEPDLGGGAESWEDAEPGPEVLLAQGDSPFATETMAGLLERQGHVEDARALRARIEPDDGEGAQGTPVFVLPEPEPLPEMPETPPAPIGADPLATEEGQEILAELEAAEPIAGASDVGELETSAEELGVPLDATARRSAHVIATLERWLDNLRRGVA